MGMTTQLLLNWAYYEPAGHVLEALQHAYGYHVANPDVEISLLLNAASVVQLTRGCP
jgi:RsiW-degrading membrane proteinase PrsW (M82 family)